MTLRVAIPDLISPSYFPAIAAVELGCFKHEGLDATLELLFPVTRTYEELREGRLDFVGGASHAALYAFRDWQGGKLLCALAQNMYWFLILKKSLGAKKGELSAVKGQRIGAAPGPVGVQLPLARGEGRLHGRGAAHFGDQGRSEDAAQEGQGMRHAPATPLTGARTDL